MKSFTRTLQRRAVAKSAPSRTKAMNRKARELGRFVKIQSYYGKPH